MWIWITLALMLAILLTALSIGYRLFVLYDRRGKHDAAPNAPGENAAPIWKKLYDTQQNALRDIEAMPRERLCIRTKDGLKLRAVFLPCEKPQGKTALLFHGYRSSGLLNMGMFVRFYHENGFDVLLPDNRAHGESEGRYIGFGVLDSTDCVAWCEEILRRSGAAQKLLLHGVSMGASTVLMAAYRGLPPQVCAVVSDCAFTSCMDEFCHVLRGKWRLPVKPLAALTNFWCKRLASFDMRAPSSGVRFRQGALPYLFIHGGDDRFVPTAMASTLFRACKSPQKELWIVPGAKHAVSYLTDQKGYEEKLAALFRGARTPTEE